MFPKYRNHLTLRPIHPSVRWSMSREGEQFFNRFPTSLRLDTDTAIRLVSDEPDHAETLRLTAR